MFVTEVVVGATANHNLNNKRVVKPSLTESIKTVNDCLCKGRMYLTNCGLHVKSKGSTNKGGTCLRISFHPYSAT